jgi:hypothetical protein
MRDLAAIDLENIDISVCFRWRRIVRGPAILEVRLGFVSRDNLEGD